MADVARGGVFISYRVKDNPLGAAGIHDGLARRFGEDRVFRDCVSMPPGVDYATTIRDRLRNADVVVPIIGPKWLAMTDPATGTRLIDREHDWVRREIAWAFQHGIDIVPVLLRDAPENAPRLIRSELPTDIGALAGLQFLEFSHRRFHADLKRLADRLVEMIPTLDRGARPQLGRPSLVELVDALEDVPCMRAHDTRSQVVGQLRPAIAGAIPYFAQRRAHVLSILRTCMDYEQGLAELLTRISDMESEDSIPLRRLVAIATRIAPELEA